MAFLLILLLNSIYVQPKSQISVRCEFILAIIVIKSLQYHKYSNITTKSCTAVTRWRQENGGNTTRKNRAGYTVPFGYWEADVGVSFKGWVTCSSFIFGMKDRHFQRCRPWNETQPFSGITMQCVRTRRQWNRSLPPSGQECELPYVTVTEIFSSLLKEKKILLRENIWFTWPLVPHCVC